MLFRYAGVIAINPNTDQTEIVKSATGTVHINEDWENPVIVQDVNGFDMTTLNTTVEGLFQDFYVEDQPVVGFKTSSGHRFYLRSSTPVPGPVGPPPVAVTAQDGNLLFQYGDGTTVTGPVVPAPAALADAEIAALVENSETSTRGSLDGMYATLDGKARQPVRKDELYYNVLDWGAYGNGTSNNDTLGVQAAIDAAHAAGGGVVLLPKRDFSVSQIRMKSKVTLMGSGWGTRLIQRTGTTGHLLILDTVSTEHTRTCNLQLHGNKDNQTAANDTLHFDNTGGSFSFYDANHIIENVLCYIPKGHGMYLSPNSRESKLINCFVTGADGSGYVLNATDSVATNCVTGAAGGTGFVLGGPNSRIVGCKAFGSGRLNNPGNRHGFRLTGRRLSLSSCEAQDNAEHGFEMANLPGALVTLTGCIADSNGRQAAGSGFRFSETSGFVLSGCLAFDRETTKTQRYDMAFGNNVTNFQVSIMSDANVNAGYAGIPVAPFQVTRNAVVTAG